MHRFSLDSVLLAQHVYPKKNSRMLDLGCGCGIISIMIAKGYPDTHIIGIDIQKDAVRLAKENVRVNNLMSQVTILERDLRSIKGNEFNRFQYVVCNPPFRVCGGGRPNQAYTKLIAREEIFCTLDDILAVSRKILVNQGELSLIYPAERIGDVMVQMSSYNITPKDLIPVYTRPAQPAKWGILKGRLNSKVGLQIHESLYV
ncbi:MAG: tRNA (adenine-N(6)-)-methyltransferase [Candidatus Magnetoglobus multicellularis str. Araruama]|uniref:tRNA (Adenine-N(6)-)-methyltransferase n=1 Tax=Candidatus Magnetoglobus multicellularis str. Araruama TaxID=890399 RepID=A0A1V1PIQ4_9BACT|nr:MAG: tRNA (adenine-N(6)-)-methyltransferase [Candidatus Magnetoglobus multicellularis str. Araruama]